MTYGVFILANGLWKLHGTFLNKADATREKSYLVTHLGLAAEVFQKRISI